MRLEKAATVVLTLAGLVFLPWQVVEITGSPALGVGIAVFLGLLLGTSALHYLFPEPYHYRFGVRRYTSRALVPRRVTRVVIDESFKAVITVWRQYVWLKQPPKNELVDLIDVPVGSEMSEAVYQSCDSVPADIVRKDPHTLAVYWAPRVELQPFVPYVHHLSYLSGSLYGDDAFWNALHVDRETGTARFVFRSHHPMESAIAFVLPPFASAVTIPRIYKAALGKVRRHCDQPELSEDRRVIHWELTNPTLGRTYVLVGFYVGGQEKFEGYAPQHLWRSRALQKLARLRLAVRRSTA